MEVPHQYHYNPPLRLILLLFGTGFLWIAVWFPYWFPGGHIPAGFKPWFSFIGLIPIALALIVAALRILFENYLLLDNDSMVLPIGLFQMRTERIEYSRIRRVWRHYIRPYERGFVLKVVTEKQSFKILPAFLPDNESYDALEQFLNRKAHENNRREKVPKKPRNYS